MQQAVAKLYPTAQAKYAFINRGNTEFPSGFADNLREQIDHLASLELQPDEADFLLEKCTFLDPVYIDFLRGYRYDPKEVTVHQSDGDLSIDIAGPWYRTILWEVKLMAIVSELYFATSPNPQMLEDHFSSPGEVMDKAREKCHSLKLADCFYGDFGTRRRLSYATQDQFIKAAVLYEPNFVGTSNVHFAMKHGIRTVGTQAHEWFTFHAAKYGFKVANAMAMGRWVDVYKGSLGIALTDTFGTENFFQAFDLFYGKLFDGVRHDSGDPIYFGEKVIDHYKKLGINPMAKTIIFSDGLTPAEAIRINTIFKDKIKVSFGIGTNFTNDAGAKPLNMVIKMVACKPNDSYDDWEHAIKLSDVSGKHTGDVGTIELARKTLGI